MNQLDKVVEVTGLPVLLLLAILLIASCKPAFYHECTIVCSILCPCLSQNNADVAQLVTLPYDIVCPTQLACYS